MRAMKDSGIEWIGQIPQEWKIGRVKHIYDVTLGKMLQPNPKSDEDELCHYMCAANINWNGVDLSVEKKMWFSPKDKESYRLATGDLLVTEGGDVAVSCIWNDELSECYFQNAVHRVRPKGNASNRYLYYWLSTLKATGYVDLVCNKATLAHFTKDKLDSCIIPIVDEGEQYAIVNYLDVKCAEIDALIAAKEKTNTLLKEQRQSIIYEAVTKGLNPDVPMKDSGIEWIGQIPEHWEVRRLKVITDMQTGTTPKTSDSEYFDGDVNWFTPSDFTGNMLITESERKLTRKAIEDGQSHFFPENTIMLVGIGATVGKTAFTQVGASCNQQITAIQTKDPARAKYYAYWLAACSSAIKATANYTTLPIINNQHLGETFCPYVGDLEEQAEIIQYLDARCAEIDQLISANEDTVQKLKEYRQSIIYEAVTGKIEV